MSDYCKYGDPFCPCQDGDPCHYEPPNPLKTPIERLMVTLERNPYEQREKEQGRQIRTVIDPHMEHPSYGGIKPLKFTVPAGVNGMEAE